MKKLLIAVLTLATLIGSIVLASPASATTTPRVRLVASTATVAIGRTFTFTASARHAAPHQKAVLQRKHGKEWVRVAVKYLPRKGAVKRVTFTQALNAPGYVTFRVKLVAKGSYSGAKSNYWTQHVVRLHPLRFNFKGAQAVAMRQTTSSSARMAARMAATAETSPTPTSNLSVVSSAGLTSNAVVSGNVTVQHFLIAPDGNVFVAFSMPVNLADTSTFSANGCVFAKVDADTGVPTCVDTDLSFLDWNTDSNAPVQFDQSGRVYYSGHSIKGNAVLRRYANGVTTDLINDNIYLRDWLVAGDGTVLISGSTTATSTFWTRRIAPTGGLQTLLGSSSTFAHMPDAANYVLNGTSTYRFTGSTLESGGWAGQPSPCTDLCANIHQRATTSDDEVFVYGTSPSQISQIYPTSQTVPLATVQDATRIAAVGSQVLVAGRNSSGINVLSRYNPATDAETALTSAANELEVYHLEAINDTTAMFDGLRFSDNRYVVGQVDLTTGQVTVLNALTSKWEDFQTF